MLPTFFGLDSVTRALMAQQEAINVVDQNISNASTPGYSRQQAITTAFDPYTAPAFDRPSMVAGQLGTGSIVTTVKRFVDEMLNSQIRAGNESSGQLGVMDDLYTQLQAIFSDPSNQAINTASTNFFNAVHDLANSPEDPSTRGALQQQGVTLSQAISNRYQQLTSLQSDLNSKVQTVVSDINSTIREIAKLNNQIAQVKGTGDNPNDLMDKRDLLADHLSTLVDTTVVQNPDGTDTIQMNGRFLVHKDQAYTLTTLVDANSPALIKPVQVFWQEDVDKFRQLHPNYDPISGKNFSTTAPLVAGVDNPPLSVSQADITFGSLSGYLQIRDDVIQDTLLPQLNELADSLTNTQVLSPLTGLKSTDTLSGPKQGSFDSFVITVLTPQNTSSPPGPGQLETFDLSQLQPPANAGGTTLSTVQDVVDAINSGSYTDATGNLHTVAPYLHASLNAAGQLQIDTTITGALVKVDQANAATTADFGFSPQVADGVNFIQTSGYGLNTPAQFVGGISGLTLNTAVTSGDSLDITGPDGTTVTVTVPAPSDPNAQLVLNPTDASPAGGISVAPTNGSPAVPGPVSVTLTGVSGLAANSTFTVTVQGTDPDGVAQTGTATFSTDASGNLLASTVSTNQVFKTVTSIQTANGFGAGSQITATVPTTAPTVRDLINAINAKGVSHGFQAALDQAGHLTIFAAPTVYGPNGQLVGTAAQITSDNTVNLTRSTLFTQDSTLTITGPAGTFPPGGGPFTAVAGSSLGSLIDSINAANIGVTASVNNAGQFQLTSQLTGSSQTISISNLGGDLDPASAQPPLIPLTLPASGSVSGLNNGYAPSAQITVAQAAGPTTSSLTPDTVIRDFFGGTTSFGQIFTAPTVNNGNLNQFFFQGGLQSLPNQLLAPTATASVPTAVLANQPFPAKISFSLIDSGATVGDQITIDGTDGNGQAYSSPEVIDVTGDGVFTSSRIYSKITSISFSAGIGSSASGGLVGILANLGSTQVDTAGAIGVDANILKDVNLIAASATPNAPGDQTNALAMLNVQQQGTISNGLVSATFGDFYGSTITTLGEAARETNINRTTEDQLVSHLQNQKQSVVGVSIDEEAANLVALQHAYAAAARAITSQDEMLNTIINGMGLVGRG